MSRFTIQPGSLVNAFRKKHTYVYLRMDFRIVRRISVKHVVFALYHVLITVQYHAGSECYRMADAIIPYGHLVVVRTLVECDNPVLCRTVGSRAIGQFCGESERTVVEYLAVGKAVGKEQLTILHQCRGTTAQTCPYGIHIHAIAVVKMEGGVPEYFFAFFALSGFLQGIALMPAPIMQAVAMLNDRIRGVLDPHVSTERTLTRPLEGRTIHAVDASVVLPSEVVQTLWVDAPADLRHKRRRLSPADGVCRHALRLYGDINQQFAVVTRLTGYLLT